MKIDEIDKNFKVETKLNKSDIVFHSIFDDPFRIYGLMYENGKFCRMPGEVANSIGGWLVSLNCNTAGGRVRFKTDSPYIAISAKMSNIGKMDHFAITGSGAFDMYVRENGVDKYSNTFRPPFDFEDGYESLFDFKFSKMREVCINFPLYSDVSELYIGLAESATVEKPTPYSVEKPIVSYGSSVTQGGCASRPGTSYQSFISRELNANYVNLGFSGSAHGEQTIADHIASLDMSVFLYDYDCNSPTPEFLAETHEPMFKKIRAAHPNVPIIMMARPHYYLDPNDVKRHAVIETTYKNALAAGDKNVYYLSGPELMALCGNEGTVDTCHPTDFGFASMAKAVGDLIEKIGCL
jgi:hypothetical protein